MGVAPAILDLWSCWMPFDLKIVTCGQLQDRTVNIVPNPLDFQAEHLGQWVLRNLPQVHHLSTKIEPLLICD